jgi:predicted DNA-binding transcriptional regulator YafY
MPLGYDLDKALRLVALVHTLERAPRTIKDLLEIYGLESDLYNDQDEAYRKKKQALEKKIRRDLEDLKTLANAAAINSLKEDSHPIQYSIEAFRKTLSQDQLLAVYSGVRLLHHHSSGDKNHYREALNVLTSWLPENIQAIMQRSQANTTSVRSNERTALEVIARAWSKTQRIKFKYISANNDGQPRDTELEIYFVEVHRINLGLYAIGHETTRHNAVRTFKLSRMQNCQVIEGSSYEIPKSFDSNKFLEHAWGIIGRSDGETTDVLLKFSPEVKRRLEEGGFPNMEIRRDNPDGSREVWIRTGTDNNGVPLEVLVWARSWGPQVEILEPQSLREIWLADARAIVERYA